MNSETERLDIDQPINISLYSY